MLTKKQIKEISEHLEKAQNPVFFYDNDADGLCSFLLLHRYLGRGKGVAVRSYPDMNVAYFKKAQEFNSDYIFILDKPVVSDEFFEEAHRENIPVVCIDHHDVQTNFPDFICYYNVQLNKEKTSEPVAVLCYQITENKNDLWLAVAGSISDRFVPDFYKEFTEMYPELSFDSKDAFDILYKSEIGKIIRMLNFGLKDSVTNVVSMQKFLAKVKNPHEVLEEGKENKTLHKTFNNNFAKYNRLLEKAIKIGKNPGKLLFFKYGGNLSASADLSNELSYLFPEKLIIVVYAMTESTSNLSIRGKRAREIFLKVIEGIEGARGGGHEMAVGGQMKTKDLDRFKEEVEKLI